MIKMAGTYFMFASHESGYSPNDNLYSTATSISGPWSAWNTFATVGSNTYSSQTNYILPLGSSGAIYMGDRWIASDLGASTYVWLPLTISGAAKTASMANYISWVPDTGAGTWAVAPSEKTLKAVSATLANGAVTQSCSGCSGGKDVGYIGGPSDGSVTFKSVYSSVGTSTTIRISYLNYDSTPRNATLTVNGVGQTLAFLPTSYGVPGTSTLNTNLRSGSSNTVEISAAPYYGPDTIMITVPVS